MASVETVTSRPQVEKFVLELSPEEAVVVAASLGRCLDVDTYGPFTALKKALGEADLMSAYGEAYGNSRHSQ